MQFSINFSNKNVRPYQHCFQTQYTDFPQCHRPSITLTFMIIQSIHTSIHISIVMIPETRKKLKNTEAVVKIFPN